MKIRRNGKIYIYAVQLLGLDLCGIQFPDPLPTHNHNNLDTLDTISLSSSSQSKRVIQTVNTVLLPMAGDQGELQDKIDRIVTRLRNVWECPILLLESQGMNNIDIREICDDKVKCPSR